MEPTNNVSGPSWRFGTSQPISGAARQSPTETELHSRIQAGGGTYLFTIQSRAPSAEPKSYMVWYQEEFNAWNIQDVADWEMRNRENRISFTMTNDGNIDTTSVRIDGQTSRSVPSKWQGVFLKLCREVAPQQRPASAAASIAENQAPIVQALLPNIGSSSIATVPSMSHSVSAPADTLNRSTILSPANLVTFRTALMRCNELTGRDVQDITIDGTRYFIWKRIVEVPKTGMSKVLFWKKAPILEIINIQDAHNYNKSNQDGKIGIIITPTGEISSIHVNNLPANEVPPDKLPLFQAGYSKALEISSRYETIPGSDQLAEGNTCIVRIQAIKRGLLEVPLFHLSNLTGALTKLIYRGDPTTMVSYLRNDLTTDDGIDVGGLSRDYIDDLFRGILTNGGLDFRIMPSSGLKIPETSRTADHLIPTPTLTKEEKKVYADMGMVMMYCYNHDRNAFEPNPITIGRHFDEALFNAVKCLSARDLNTPFQNLNDETKLNMCRALVNARTVRDNPIELTPIKRTLDFIQFYNLTDPKQNSRNTIEALAGGMMQLPSFPKKFFMVDADNNRILNNMGNPQLDWDSINNNLDEFNNFLIQTIGGDMLVTAEALEIPVPEQFGSIDDYTANIDYIKTHPDEFKAFLSQFVYIGNDSGGLGVLGSKLAPIHAIAQGMKLFSTIGNGDPDNSNENRFWDQMFHSTNADFRNDPNPSYVRFSDKIQGVINRQAIANAIVIGEGIEGNPEFRAEINKKVGWLREWINAEPPAGATDEEVRNLLKFFTGASNLPINRQINVTIQFPNLQGNYSPIPIAHTCFFSAEFSPVGCGSESNNDRTKDAFIRMIREHVLPAANTFQLG